MKKIEKRIKTIANHDAMDGLTRYRRDKITEVVKQRSLRQKVAMNTHYELFDLYQRKFNITTAEPCPCDRDTDPSPECTLCYGTGILPAYYKFGYTSNVIMHANAAVTSVNCKVNYNNEDSPPQWFLLDNALNGKIESYWIPAMSTGNDNAEIWSGIDLTDNRIKLQYTIDDIEWLDINTFSTKLKESSKYKIRVFLKRDSLNEKSIGFPGLHIRYKNSGYTHLRCTQPQWSIMDERILMGNIDIIESNTFITTGNVEVINVGDFFEHLNTSLRFRVHRIQNHHWDGTVMEWELSVRKLHTSELLSNII